MILRNPQFSLGQKREISHGLDSGACISKQALFSKEQIWLLPLRLSQMKYTEYVQGKDSKISFAFLLLTTVMMFTSTICVTSFHKYPLSIATVSKTYWKLWLQMPLWKLAFLRGPVCSSTTEEGLVCLYLLLASFCCSLKSEDLF